MLSSLSTSLLSKKKWMNGDNGDGGNKKIF